MSDQSKGIDEYIVVDLIMQVQSRLDARLRHLSLACETFERDHAAASKYEGSRAKELGLPNSNRNKKLKVT